MALQPVVPTASPAWPVEALQRTATTAVSSDAVPDSARLAEVVVVTLVREGEAILKLGGVLSDGGWRRSGGGLRTGWRRQRAQPAAQAEVRSDRVAGGEGGAASSRAPYRSWIPRNIVRVSADARW